MQIYRLIYLPCLLALRSRCEPRGGDRLRQGRPIYDRGNGIVYDGKYEYRNRTKSKHTRDTPVGIRRLKSAHQRPKFKRRRHGAMNYANGITLYRDSGRDRIVSRGFNIDNIQEDGVASSVSITAQGTLGFSKEFTDLEFYDRVEVLRGVAGLTQSNGERRYGKSRPQAPRRRAWRKFGPKYGQLE